MTEQRWASPPVIVGTTLDRMVGFHPEPFDRRKWITTTAVVLGVALAAAITLVICTA